MRQNKMLPGVYTNFSVAQLSSASSRTGVISLALALPWLAAKTMYRITKSIAEELYFYLGSAALPIKEALKNANEVLLYKLNAGTASAATIGNLTCTAANTGAFGNSISVIIAPVIGEDGYYYVSTYIGGNEYDRQKVMTADQLQDNAWVVFTHSATGLTSTAGTTLTGGEDGTVTNADYISYLETLELYDFNAIACVAESADIKQLYIEFTKRLVNDEGRYFQCVVADEAADFEAVISVKNGVILSDGSAVTKEIACAYIAGATASVDLSASLTNSQYIGAVNVDTRYTTAQQTDIAQSGHILFIPELDNKVYIQKDINSLVTLSPERTEVYRKNKVIRTLFAIAAEIKRLGREQFIGKVSNTADGRNLFKSAVLVYFRQLATKNIISDVSPEDITVTEGNASDNIILTYTVRPVDTIDIIYNTIVVSV